MKIAIIGATGNIGSALLSEALSRGHEVTAIVRHPEKLATLPRLRSVRADVLADSDESLAETLKEHDVVVSAFNPGWTHPNLESAQVEGSLKILAATKRAGVKRSLSVGGAGSLEVAPGVTLLDVPAFPEAYKPAARALKAVLLKTREERELDWTILSPSAMIQPGERTGTFRLGKDSLLTDASGESRISTQDYAVALLDEVEKPAHSRQRFTVGY